MSISVNKLTEKINESSARATIPELDLLQLQVAANAISQVYSVASTATLPTAANNKGRMIYVVGEKTLFYSDGTSWSRDFSSRANSLIYTFGNNAQGQLGDATTVNKSSPVFILCSDWIQVSAGNGHTAALRTNGTLWAWGCRANGELGNGDGLGPGSDFLSSPVAVLGGFTDWCQVSAGILRTSAVRTNGTLWTWGDASDGALGDGTNTDKCSPVSVVGGFTDWCQVSAGAVSMAAVRQNGTLWAWGSGLYGRLGDNTTVNKSSPVSVIGGFTDWCQVSAGGRNTAAVRTNGTLWIWGLGIGGLLGDGTAANKSSPVSVVGGFTDWCQVSAGNLHNAAVRQNGTLWTWGCGANGYLGDGTTVNKSSPVSVVGGFTDWCQVSAGGIGHTSALRTNGTLWSWGFNSYGRLGNNSSGGGEASPVSVVGGITAWSQVSAGGNHTAAVSILKRGI